MKKTLFVAMMLIDISSFLSLYTIKAGGTIYITADGSIDPPTAPIQRDGDIYTLTDNINDTIIIEKSNITIDGKGYTLQGSGAGEGFTLSSINNVTIINTNINNYNHGVRLDSSDNSTFSNNTITNNKYGVRLSYASGNTFSSNIITNNEYGIQLHYASGNNTFSSNIITNNEYDGVRLYSASGNNTFSSNTITDSSFGVYLSSSGNNTFSSNTITDSEYGIHLRFSSGNNTFSNNTITKNEYGVHLWSSSGNSFYHNVFVFNDVQVYTQSSVNFWDHGYPSGGNYWSDYTGNDFHSGSYQNETGSDGIGDRPYVMDENNQDRYPLMNPYIPIGEMRVLYYELLEKYNSLLADHQSLNSTYHEISGNYTQLLTDYNNLNSVYNELKSKYDTTTNELNNMRNIMYVFIITTIIFIVTTVYFAIRKPRMKP